MSFTKATLTTAIQDYTDNSETIFVNNIPNFIKAAEEKIFKSVDLDYFRKNVTSNMTLNDPFLSTASSATITVIEPSHGRSTSDTVRFRDAIGFDGFTATVLNNSSGYAITKVDDNTYTFSASSGTATTGGVRGGGGRVTAGPVTLGT